MDTGWSQPTGVPHLKCRCYRDRDCIGTCRFKKKIAGRQVGRQMESRPLGLLVCGEGREGSR